MRWLGRFIGTLTVAAAELYCLGLIAWMGAQGLAGDRWLWLFLLNSFSFYLFLPALLIPIVAWRSGRRWLWLGFALAVVGWGWHLGPDILPKSGPANANGPIVTVMTFNSLGFNLATDDVVKAVASTDADIVAIQELNPLVAMAIRTSLADRYPYWVLDPLEGVSGMGVFSRYPIWPSGERLGDEWTGVPQLLTVELPGRQQITLINFHALAPALNFLAPDADRATRHREHQANLLATFAREHSRPLLVVGDYNATPMSAGYRILTSALRDSWREVGWGPGHTFPGAYSPGSSAPRPFGQSISLWLVRIDYILHSPHWRALSAEIGPWDGTSDHRSVVARLQLVA